MREEASLAKDAGKLVPVFIDPVKAPFGFSLIQGADLSTWDGSATHPSWRNLQEVLERRLGRPAEIAAAPSTPRRRSKRAIAWAAGAIVATTLVGIAITVRPSPHDPDHEQRLEPVETSQNPAKVSPESSAPSAVDAPAPPVAPPPSKEGEGRKGVSKAQPIAPVSKDLAQLLSQAQSALARDHVDEAERLARKALSEQSGSAAAYVVLAKTHCHRRDLGSVNAMMRNLNAADRRSVRVYCESRGFSLPR